MNIFRNLAIRKPHEKTSNFLNISGKNRKKKESTDSGAWRHTVARLTICKELPQTDRHCHTPAEKIRAAAAAAAATSVSGRTAAYRGGQALKRLLRETRGVSTGAVTVSAGWAFSSRLAFHVPTRSSPSMVPSTSLSNVTLEPNKLGEEFLAEFF
jgi:hypothetical protein